MCADDPRLSLRCATKCQPNDAGFQRFPFGRTTVTALCDGHFALHSLDVLRGDAVSLGKLLECARLGPVVHSHVNAFLVEHGTHRILIDTGAGALQDDTLGQLTVRLAAAGVQPEQIDMVLLTHLHPDHIGGLVRDGTAVFPHAEIYLPRVEAAFWLGNSHRDVDASVLATFEHARHILAPYQGQGRCHLFDPGASWHGLIAAESLPGHTSGHTGYRLHADDGDIVFCGDLFHVAGVQLADPGIAVCYDSEPMQARTTRAMFLAKACKDGDIVAAAHAPFPGLGHIEAAGESYAWRPLA